MSIQKYIAETRQALSENHGFDELMTLIEGVESQIRLARPSSDQRADLEELKSQICCSARRVAQTPQNLRLGQTCACFDEEFYRSLLQSNPESALVWLNAAKAILRDFPKLEVSLENKRLILAGELLQTSWKLDSKAIETCCAMAEVYGRLHQPVNGLKCLETAYELGLSSTMDSHPSLDFFRFIYKATNLKEYRKISEQNRRSFSKRSTKGALRGEFKDPRGALLWSDLGSMVIESHDKSLWLYSIPGLEPVRLLEEVAQISLSFHTYTAEEHRYIEHRLEATLELQSQEKTWCLFSEHYNTEEKKLPKREIMKCCESLAKRLKLPFICGQPPPKGFFGLKLFNR